MATVVFNTPEAPKPVPEFQNADAYAIGTLCVSRNNAPLIVAAAPLPFRTLLQERPYLLRDGGAYKHYFINLEDGRTGKPYMEARLLKAEESPLTLSNS